MKSATSTLQACLLTVLTTLSICCVNAQQLTTATEAQAAKETQLHRPSAILAAADGSQVLVASFTKKQLLLTDVESTQHRTIETQAPIVEMAWLQTGSSILALTSEPPLLMQLNLADGIQMPASLLLDHRPAKLAINDVGVLAAVTMTENCSVVIIELQGEKQLASATLSQIDLGFPPKEILWMGATHFLVADAFGGGLVVIDAVTASIVARHRITGHHIGGLAFDRTSNSVLVSHQRLSKIAETGHDDIHWGTLMQNLISKIDVPKMLDPTRNISATAQQFRLGTPGHGCADPSSISVWMGGRFAVSITGSDEVAVGQLESHKFQFVRVGAKPTRLAQFGVDGLLCVNELDGTVSLLRGTNELKVERTIGTANGEISAAEQGERDFFSGRLSHDGWMSCNSCHVDGFTPDLLADTLGDGRFGNAKRIPSLYKTSLTGPLGWDGSKLSLADQILSTLDSTMHRDAAEREKLTDREITDRLIAYLETKDAVAIRAAADSRIESRDLEAVSLGAAIFQARECSKCHDPSNHFTSSNAYDVGVTDEYGARKFNPPALSQLGLRRWFFHDGRFNALDEVLKNHPSADASFSDDERKQLKAYLLSLQ